MSFNDRSTIRTRVIEYLDGRTDIDTKVNTWINDARRHLATKYDFSYLFTEATATTSAGTARYALPADYLGHLNLFIGTKKLMRLRTNEFDSIHGEDVAIEDADGTTKYLYTTGSSEQDEPDYYIDRGMEFDLYPTPNGTLTLTIRYYANPEDWTSDVDYDYISTFHNEAVIFGATLRGAIYLEDDDKTKKFEVLYKQEIQAMIQHEKNRQNADTFIRWKSYKDFSPTQFKRIVKMNNS